LQKAISYLSLSLLDPTNLAHISTLDTKKKNLLIYYRLELRTACKATSNLVYRQPGILYTNQEHFCIFGCVPEEEYT
jgi:hypothetical protein